MKLVTLLILALSAGPANAQVTSGKHVDEVLKWERDGSKVDLAVLFTDTLVKMNGRWQLVAGHVSKPPARSGNGG